MAKKILHITTSLKRGGAEQLLFTLIKNLQGHFDQEVIYFYEGPFVEKIKALDISVHPLCGLKYYNPAFWWRLFCLIKKINPDCIHSLLWTANTAARILGYFLKIPVICAIHSPLNSNTGQSKIRAVIDWLTMGWAAHVVCVSDDISKRYNLESFIPACKITVICNGVDIEEEDKIRSEATLPFVRASGDQAFILGTVGRLVKIKNHRLLLPLMVRLKKSMPQVRLLIVGEGALEGSLSKEIHDLGLSEEVKIVHGWGADYYPFFDLFISPSFAEGMSIALLEALAYGIPAIAAHEDTHHPVITHGIEGYIFNVNDIDQLEKYVLGVINNDDKRKKMGKNAKDLIERNFSGKLMSEHYMRVFQAFCRVKSDFKW